MNKITVINEFSIEAIRDALQKLDDFDNLIVNGFTAFELNEIEKIDPVLFDSIAKRICEKRWVPFCGMWAEENEKISADKLIRNVMYSSLYFKEKFDLKFRVFYGSEIYNNRFSQIIYLGGFDAAVLKNGSEKFWLDSPDSSRTLVVSENCGDFEITDINDIDDEYIKNADFTSFEEYVPTLFHDQNELTKKTVSFEVENSECEKLLLKAERIATENSEMLCVEIQNAWISLFLGDENSAKSVAEKIIGDRKISEDFIKINKGGIEIISAKFSEDLCGDLVLRIIETDGKEKSLNILCDKKDASFRCEIMPYEMQTFRIDKDGFVKETLLTE